MALLKHICQKLNLLALKDSLYNQFSTIACIVTKWSMLLPNFKINMSREDQNIFSVEGKVFESFAPWPSSSVQVHNVDNITVQNAEVMRIKHRAVRFKKAKHKNSTV